MPKSVVVRAIPLPATNESLQLKKKATFNDVIKFEIMNGAYEAILPFIQAVNDKDAVNGSIRMDNAGAAAALQKYGRDNGKSVLANANWEQLHHSIAVALNAIRDEDGNKISRRARRLVALAKAGRFAHYRQRLAETHI